MMIDVVVVPVKMMLLDWMKMLCSFHFVVVLAVAVVVHEPPSQPISPQ